MYILYCLWIWLLVYTLPALAFFPKLIVSPRTAFAIPVLSAFIIYIFCSFSLVLGFLTTSFAYGIAIGLGLTASWRLISLFRLNPLWEWKKETGLIYAFHLCLLLPFFVKLGTHGFERGDEIYSWNFWAIQHYLLVPIDFSHTGAPYPQLFPKLLAFSYHLVNSLDLQLPVRATLVIFPWSLLCAIVMTLRTQTVSNFYTYIILLVYVLFGVGLAQFFDDAYADPVMTSCLIVSAALFWQSQQVTHRTFFSRQEFALLSVLAGITAAHTKQPALLWSLFTLPLLLWRMPILSIISLAGGLSWVFTEGKNFHQNHGVLSLSFENRNFIEQFIFAFNKYFIQQPLLFFLFLMVLFISIKQQPLRKMSGLFLLPSLLCWLLFGAYQLRLGQHLIAFAFFLIMASGYHLPLQKFSHFFSIKRFALLSTTLSLMLSLGLFLKAVLIEKPHLSFYEGNRYRLQRYFEQDSDFIYHNIYLNKKAILWMPSRYLYGLFYPHDNLITPQYIANQPYLMYSLIHELQQKSPDYVFLVNSNFTDGPACALLAEAVFQCPGAFDKISEPENKFGFITYKVNKQILKQDPCLAALGQSDFDNRRFQTMTQL